MMEIDLTNGNVQLAEYILKGDTTIKYLRKQPTVGLAKVPVRDTSGTILKDVPWKKKRVICSGIPYGCLIGFILKDELYIGWSKRLELQYIPENEQLHKLFTDFVKSIHDPKMVGKMPTKIEAIENYKDLFSVFSNQLASFMTANQPKDVEIAFSKKIGKMTAVIRGLGDGITFDGNNITSRESDVIPSDIAKQLRHFTDGIEAKYDKKAANVVRKETMAVGKPIATGLPVV
ncbi:MAG: hypothetical protein E3J47_08220 [Candidatus Stahlbacteria bacterium]|nr:MAG: hypothetical protein E3J47_08220 [Candidatus Stahlbacteria bacterium]